MEQCRYVAVFMRKCASPSVFHLPAWYSRTSFPILVALSSTYTQVHSLLLGRRCWCSFSDVVADRYVEHVVDTGVRDVVPAFDTKTSRLHVSDSQTTFGASENPAPGHQKLKKHANKQETKPQHEPPQTHSLPPEQQASAHVATKFNDKCTAIAANRTGRCQN